MKTFIISMMVFFPGVILSQESWFKDNSAYFRSEKKVKRLENIDGSQFLNSDSSFYAVQNFKDVKMRYNAYSDQIEYKDVNGNIFEIERFVDKPIIFKDSNQTFVFKNFTLGKTPSSSYLRVIGSDAKNHVLFVREKIILVPFDKSQTSLMPDTNPYLTNVKKLYVLSIQGGDPVTFYNKKEFFKVFDDKDFSKFVKDNKIDFDSESDVLELVNFMNIKK